MYFNSYSLSDIDDDEQGDEEHEGDVTFHCNVFELLEETTMKKAGGLRYSYGDAKKRGRCNVENLGDGSWVGKKSIRGAERRGFLCSRKSFIFDTP